MRLFKTLLFTLILIHPIFGQVCCSIVGSINNGGGTSSTNWGKHWPSKFDDRKSFNWVGGFNTTFTSDDHLRIRYGASVSAHGQISHYIGKRNIGYIQLESSWLQIEEFLSFSNSSSDVFQLGFKTGMRHLLSGKLGYIFEELSLPKSPTFTNTQFPFTTGAVPIFMVGYTNRIQMPWAIKSPSFLADLSLSVSLSKNQKIQDNVFLDDAVNIHLSSSIYWIKSLALSPFSALQSQKLIAPLTPWDTERQSRRLNVMIIGLDLTPTHHDWRWLHLRIDFPVYQWTSNGLFPDGSEPVPRISLSINNNGVFQGKKKI